MRLKPLKVGKKRGFPSPSSLPSSGLLGGDWLGMHTLLQMKGTVSRDGPEDMTALLG